MRNQAQARLDIVKEANESSEAQLADIRTSIITEKASRLDSVRPWLVLPRITTHEHKQEERIQALEQLSAKKKEYGDLEKELSAYGACDPTKVEEKKRGGMLAHEAAVRWTGESPVAYMLICDTRH